MNLDDNEKYIYNSLGAEEQSELQAMWNDTAIRNKVTKAAAAAIGVLLLLAFVF